MLSRGKLAVDTALGIKRKKRLSPAQSARLWIEKKTDQDGLQMRHVSDYIGYGVYATKTFNKGDFILEYCGKRISSKEAEDISHNYLFGFKYCGDFIWIDGFATDRLGRYINDAPERTFECNGKMKLLVFDSTPHICLFATRTINVGEEIRYDYGDVHGDLFWRYRHYENTTNDPDPFDVGSYVSETDDDGSIDQFNADECSNLSAASRIVPLQTVKDIRQLEVSSWQEKVDHFEPIFTKEVPVCQKESIVEQPLLLQEVPVCQKESIVEQRENGAKNKSKKKPDRYCLYCESLVMNGKLKRHILRRHRAEPEIQEIIKKPRSLQNVFFDKKRRDGIYAYNLNLLSTGNEAKMRERQAKDKDMLRVCLDCHGYYSNRCFFKHKCVSKDPESVKPHLLSHISGESYEKDDSFKDILNRFRDGAIGDLCRSDNFIKLIGYRHYNLRKHEAGKEDEVRKVVMAEMRELAKLFQIFQDLDETKRSLEDMFSRQHLSDLVQAIMTLTTKEDKTEKHGQKLLIDAIIMRSIKTLKGHYNESMQDDKEEELKKFKSAYKHRSNEIYPKARATCVAKSFQKARRPASLPDEKAIQMLKIYMTSEINYLVENYHIRHYVNLSSLVVARLTLYNARRGEEAARLLQNEWLDACSDTWLPKDKIETVYDPAEDFLIGQFKLAYLNGKGRKFVPVLIPIDLMEGLSILNRDREAFGIKRSNLFLFGTRNSQNSHCSGWHAVSTVCKMASIDLPINATKMRHRLSSVFASLDMNAHDRKIFMDHMGHDEEINKDNYQCPPGLQAISVMGKMLSNADRGVNDNEMTGHSNNIHGEQRVFNFDENNANEDESEIDDDEYDEHISPRKSYKSNTPPVRWSKSDTNLVREAFRDFVFSEKGQANSKGSLPSKSRIVQFLKETPLASLNTMTEKEQYMKIRSKVFNERKTARLSTQQGLRKISVKKNS